MRQRIRHDPSVKEFEAYLDYSGGRNLEISNERLKDNESPELLNVDLSGRGSVRRRYGRTKILSVAGSAQGMFFFYRSGTPSPDIILAVSGKLYVKQYDSSTAVQVNITDNGSPFTFQTTRTVEAVQYGPYLYVATGTKLTRVFYESSTWKAETVQPYAPTVLEAIYIGTNALATTPDSYVQDGTSVNLEVAGIKPQKRTGTVNKTVTMTAYINKPASITSVDYKWEYKKSSDANFSMGRDWTNGTSGKTWDFLPDTATNYDVKLTVRDNAVQTTTAVYSLTNYKVNQVEDKTNDVLPYQSIQSCTRILLHWDRIILYGSTDTPYQCFISDLQNPAYVPTTNTINFDTGKQEPITVMVRFQNMLVVFTSTTIQTMLGKSPQDYSRYQIHDGLGCVAGWSARVVGNNIMFLSHEGVHALKPNQYRLETMNVIRADSSVKSDIDVFSNACAVVNDSQYWLAMPTDKVVHRLYYEQAVWSKDSSTKLNIIQFITYGEDVYNLTSDGNLYVHDKSVYTDDGEVYDMYVESKYYDLSASFNYKKLKKLYVLAKHFQTHNVELSVYVKADSAVVLTPESGHSEVQDGYVVWVTSSNPNMTYYAGTVFGAWIMGKSPLGSVVSSVNSTSIRGKCRRVKVIFVHKQPNECEIFGIGLEFKLKKP